MIRHPRQALHRTRALKITLTACLIASVTVLPPSKTSAQQRTPTVSTRRSFAIEACHYVSCREDETQCACAARRLRAATLCTQSQAGAISALRDQIAQDVIAHAARTASIREQCRAEHDRLTHDIETLEDERDRRWPRWVAVVGTVSGVIMGTIIGRIAR